MLYASGLVCCAFLNGCFCRYREYVIVSVADVGDNISTKYKYHVLPTGVYDYVSHKDALSYDVLSYLGIPSYDKLKDEIPNVFSDTGIPVVLQMSTRMTRYKYGWSDILGGFSLMLVPAFHHSETEHTFEIIMADDDSVRGTFTVTDATEHTVGATPTAWLPFAGAPEHGDKRVYWRSGNAVGTEGMIQKARSEFYDNCPDFKREGFTYGIVAKLKEMEDSGAVDAMLKKIADAKSQIPGHRIVKYEKDEGCDFAYVFAIELLALHGNMDNVAAAVVREFGEQIKEQYVAAYPYVSKTSLIVDFPELRVIGKLITGRAIVLTIEPTSMTYDADTRRGKVSVRFADGQYEEARKWIRKNIETLARDKNIALVTRQLPPDANCYLLGEKIDGNVMTIEFKTE